MSLTVRVSAIVSLFVAFMLAAIIAIISLRLAAEVNALSLADNQQITVARSLQLGELMDKLYWQLKMISVRNQFMTGDKKTIESAVLALNGKLSPEVVGAFYVWPNGDYLTTEGARANVADRDYFTAIMEQGADAYVGEAVISKALGAPIVVSAMAVKGVDGKTRGFAALQFKLEKLSEITNGIKVGKTGYGWIMDNTGLMIAHANAKAIMTLNATNADKDGARGMDALAKRVLSEEAGHGTYYNANGQQMTVFYVRVPNTPRWTLGVSVPTAEINATATALTNLLLLSCSSRSSCRSWSRYSSLGRSSSQSSSSLRRWTICRRAIWRSFMWTSESGTKSSLGVTSWARSASPYGSCWEVCARSSVG
jgi:methyl-accepting chemotaxis protein